MNISTNGIIYAVAFILILVVGFRVNTIKQQLIQELSAHNLNNVTITARPKHIYSIYNKMDRKDLPLEQIYDIRAVRVMVENLTDCYLVLGSI